MVTQSSLHAEQITKSDDEENSAEQAMLEMAADLQSLLETALDITSSSTETDYNQIFLVSTQSHSKQLVCVARRLGKSGPVGDKS
ncbi:MAG: hypothetical protein ABJX35_01680 [Hyphomicrobiales bacterium]